MRWHFSLLRIVRWMCGVTGKVKDRVERETRIRLDDIISVLQQNRLQWYGHVLWKEDNDWSMKWRVPDQEVDQRKLGQRLCKKTVMHIN